MHFPTIKNKTRMSVLATLNFTEGSNGSNQTKKKKKMKGIQIGKEEVKLSLFGDYISYTQKILRNILQNYQN